MSPSMCHFDLKLLLTGNILSLFIRKGMLCANDVNTEILLLSHGLLNTVQVLISIYPDFCRFYLPVLTSLSLLSI